MSLSNKQCILLTSQGSRAQWGQSPQSSSIFTGCAHARHLFQPSGSIPGFLWALSLSSLGGNSLYRTCNSPWLVSSLASWNHPDSSWSGSRVPACSSSSVANQHTMSKKHGGSLDVGSVLLCLRGSHQDAGGPSLENHRRP